MLSEEHIPAAAHGDGDPSVARAAPQVGSVNFAWQRHGVTHRPRHRKEGNRGRFTPEGVDLAAILCVCLHISVILIQ